MELMTDTNGSYWLDKAYLKEMNMPYLMSSTGQTKRLNYNDMTITDEQLKGDLELSYIIERVQK